MILFQIRVITKLPNSEQFYKGKVKTHKYINRQNQSTTGKLWKRNDSDFVQAFLKKWWVESDFKAPNLPLSLRLKVSGCHYNSIYNNTWTKQFKSYLVIYVLLCWYIQICKRGWGAWAHKTSLTPPFLFYWRTCTKPGKWGLLFVS